MTTNLRRICTLARLSYVFCILCFVAVGVATLGMFDSSRSIAQQADGSAPLEVGDWSQDQVVLAADEIPVPTLSCPPCWLPIKFSENFDNVLPPLLPSGWTATNAQGPPPLWVTSSSGVPAPPANTLPNATFIDDPGVVSDKRLDWQTFAGPGSELVFWHNFNLEASDVDPTLGFDGAVLEVSTDGGNTFQDIIDAGGTFVEGGYNRTIAADRGSPIAGRQAWSGNSQGFIATVVDISEGGNFLLRWRMASDESGESEGWRVDTVNITWCKPIPSDGGPTPPCGPTPPPTATPTPRSTPRPRPTPHPRLTPHPRPSPP